MWASVTAGSRIFHNFVWVLLDPAETISSSSGSQRKLCSADGSVIGANYFQESLFYNQEKISFSTIYNFLLHLSQQTIIMLINVVQKGEKLH